ncbi:MAG TPA: hypothetical protein VNS79_10970 [Sphingobium sp.]|nr:hypothetical protein [Sphingobium sp.]
MKPLLTSRDWFGKASAGTLLGFVLALGLSGLLMHALGESETFLSPRGQLSMWSMALTWPGILSFCFLFRSGARAWGWLTLASLLVWAPLLLIGLFA